ncbi:hypothetical protein V060_02626 [Staphylococcus aureus R0294]|uniref:hypothetical protein n=1 Tax=Staphylococcus aureus TaxID=1280 RepID=UPI00044AE592|nr:hypothetical protein [Staphylococcus aureus]EZY60311.1 hypothetical protein V060_02626 [Staphylococcus aureus R0294]
MNADANNKVHHLFENEIGNEWKNGYNGSKEVSSGGGSMNEKYITKEVFEQFEKRIDNKLDSLPDRMADKMDAKISGLEARQTKWFVGIAISTAIGGLSLIVGAAGLILNLFI